MSNWSAQNWICISARCVAAALSVMVATAPQAQLADFDDAEFKVSAISVRSANNPQAGQLDLYVQVPIHKLGFESSPRGFTATYTVKAEFSKLDEQGRPQSVTLSPIWEQSVTLAFHGETQKRTTADVTTHSVTLDPGQYLIAIQYTDHVSQQVYFQEFTASVRRFDRPLTLSDLILLESYDPTSQQLTPLVTGELPADAVKLDLYYLIYTDSTRTVTLTQEVLPVDRARNAFADSGTNYVWTDTIAVSAGQHQQVSTIPLHDFEAGHYRVIVTLRDELGHVRDTAERIVVFRWYGLSAYTDNLDEAIEQLVYIARNREFNAFRRTSNEEERLRLFKEFWDKRDPTPGTTRNERMEEHYYRIDYANRKFRRRVPGWQTDRGLVFVLHGQPDDTNRQTYSYNSKPWEIWYFYRIGRQFIFVDQTGFGDYELVVPVWDDRNRID